MTRETWRRSFLPLLAGGLSALALACGGGNELAPPLAVAEGTGFAAISLCGEDLPTTSLVTAGISNRLQVNVAVSDPCPITFDSSPVPEARLSRNGLTLDPIIVTDCDPPGTVYVLGADFDANRIVGSLTAIPSGGIAAGTTVSADYQIFDDLLTVDVGVSTTGGDLVTVKVFNLPSGLGGAAVITATANTPPPDGSLAFRLGSTFSDLTELRGVRYTLVADPQNELTLNSSDLRNQLDPCIDGSLHAMIQNQATLERCVLDIDFMDPYCP